MPCDQIRTTTVDFGHANIQMLIKAMEKLGWKVHEQSENMFRATKGQFTTTFRNGQFTTESSGYQDTSSAIDTSELKREVSRQSVSHAAQRFGWSIKQINENKFEVKRRTY
jgi:hypothetical protein